MRAEDTLQIATVKFLHHALPPDAVFTGVEHAQQMSPRAGSIRKAKGVRRGLSDLMIWWRGKFIAVELKTDAGRMSDAQKEFADGIVGAGFAFHCCRSIHQVEAVLRDAGLPLRASAAGIDTRLAARVRKPGSPRAPRAQATAKARRFASQAVPF